MGQKFDWKFWSDVATFAGALGALVVVGRMMLASDPTGYASADQKKRAKENLRRLNLPSADRYETMLLANLVTPDEITTGFADIGGLDGVTQELKEKVLFPLVYSTRARSPLLQAPKGVLLYGPPGCGKTMLAKAMARESNANFLNIQASAIMDKWFGESNKMVAALFSLATKLSPCIIFIDEIDSFLRTRASSDHELSAQLKAEFMVCWDGLTSQSSGVLVLGATNRIFDIDEAVLRRMPKRFKIGKPEARQREQILRIALQGTRVSDELDYASLVDATAGMSGSAIVEFCRNAAMEPMKELYREWCTADSNEVQDEEVDLRPLRTEDFCPQLNVGDVE